MKPQTPSSLRFKTDKTVVSGLHHLDQQAILEKLKIKREVSGDYTPKGHRTFSSSSFRDSRQSKVLEKMKDFSVLPDNLSDSEGETEMEQLRFHLLRNLLTP